MKIEPEHIQEIEQKIRAILEQYEMVPHDARFVVGVSGGADSMMLLHFLYHFTSGNVIAAHVNHNLRGEAALSDQEFVQAYCKENAIPCFVHSAQVAQQAKQAGKSVEEYGREVRYAFFQSLLQPGDRIATAHTLSDQMETVIFRLAKGTGLRGLRGIPPVRGSIVRPLLWVTRQEVESYNAFYHIPFVTDATNLEREYERNQIRLDVVPLLRRLNPEVETAFLRLTRQAEQDEAYLTECAQKLLHSAKRSGGYEVRVLLQAPACIRRRAVLDAIGQIERARLSSAQIEAVDRLLQQGTGAVTVAGGVVVRMKDALLCIEKKPEKKKEWGIPLSLSKTLTADGRTVIIGVLNRDEYEKQLKFNKLLFNNAINYDTITGNIFLRNRRDGDKFQPARRGVTKTLKKLFNEAKVPLPQREKLLILSSETEILWVEGFGPSQKSMVGKHTEKIALITVKESSENVERHSGDIV